MALNVIFLQERQLCLKEKRDLVVELIYVFLAIAIIAILFIVVLIYFFSVAFVKKGPARINDMDSTISEALKPFSAIMQKGMNFIKNTPHEQIYTKSFDGITLAANYYHNNSSCTIFLFHGYRSNGAHDFSCAVEMYYKMGFNILLVDQRAHGKSGGRLITFGVKESRDVVSWAEFINQKYAPKQIVITGISMGATTVLLSLEHNLPSNVVGVIADCGFTSAAEIIEKVGRDSYKINAGRFLPFLDFACRIFGGFSIMKASTVEAVKKTKLPILFIHGKKDNFVPCEMTEKTFAACADNCSAYYAAEAGHGTSFLTDTPQVLEQLKKFLNFCLKDI